LAGAQGFWVTRRWQIHAARHLPVCDAGSILVTEGAGQRDPLVMHRHHGFDGLCEDQAVWREPGPL